MKDVIDALKARYDHYSTAEISESIFDGDVMFSRTFPHAESMAHYMGVGRSAIDAVAAAMLLAGKGSAGSVLDLPSGAGRVTRHLRAFFPDADLYVAELDRPCQAFAAEHFDAKVFPSSFDAPPERRFDLIFVGSLLTHFNEAPFKHALSWLIDALAPDGILVVTVHGRTHDAYQRNNRFYGPDIWNPVHDAWQSEGFGYVQTQELEGESYGFSLSRPSWLLRQIEDDPAIRLLSFTETGWDNHQDVLCVQKRSIL